MRDVSVVIPIFNQASLLNRCVASINEQYLDDIEVIVVDDGSDPPVPNPTIRIPHSGASTARNVGASLSRRPLIFFCDVDVVLHPTCLSLMVSALDDDEYSFAYSDFQVTLRSERRTIKSRVFSPNHLRSDNYISTMSMVRKSDFPGFDWDLERFQDWALWLNMARRGKKGIYIPKTLFMAEVDGISNSQDGWRWRERVLKRYESSRCFCS